MKLLEGSAHLGEAVTRSLKSRVSSFPLTRICSFSYSKSFYRGCFLFKNACRLWDIGPGSTFPQTRLPGGDVLSMSEGISHPQPRLGHQVEISQPRPQWYHMVQRKRDRRRLSDHPTHHLKTNLEIRIPCCRPRQVESLQCFWLLHKILGKR